MPLEKPSEIGIHRLEARIGDLKKRLDKVSRLTLLKGAKDWEILNQVLDEQVAMYQKAMNNHLEGELDGDMTDHDFRSRLRVLRARREDFEWFIKLIVTPDREAETLKEGILNLEEDLLEKRQAIDDFGLKGA